MQNYVSIHEHQTRPNPARAAVHGQAALLLRYEVSIYYVLRELLAAAARMLPVAPFLQQSRVTFLPAETK